VCVYEHAVDSGGGRLRECYEHGGSRTKGNRREQHSSRPSIQARKVTESQKNDYQEGKDCAESGGQTKQNRQKQQPLRDDDATGFKGESARVRASEGKLLQQLGPRCSANPRPCARETTAPEIGPGLAAAITPAQPIAAAPATAQPAPRSWPSPAGSCMAAPTAAVGCADGAHLVSEMRLPAGPQRRVPWRAVAGSSSSWRRRRRGRRRAGWHIGRAACCQSGPNRSRRRGQGSM
jgi:hypothetical protein